MMKPVGALSAIILILLVSLALSGCSGGGGGGEPPPPPMFVTIKGTVDDGTAASPIANATCRFEQQDSTNKVNAPANAAGAFTLLLEPGVEGFFLCHPPALRRLTLSRFISTVGQVVGDEITGKDVTPESTVVAERLMQFPAAVRRAEEADLQAAIAAQDPNIMLLVDITTRLYKSLLTEQVDVDVGDSEEGGDGDDDDGESEGEAGDGAEGSPIPGAKCDFVLTLQEDTALVRSVLGDIFDNGVLNRPDLSTVRDQVPIEDKDALATAFNALFPLGISFPITTVADDAGRYKLRIPPAVPGVVRCEPPEEQQRQLRLANVIPGLQPRQSLDLQDVTPQTTFFSTTIDDPATINVAEAKEAFLNAIMGLVVVADSADTGFDIMDPDAVMDKDVGLVAFSATALFNCLRDNGIDVDYLKAQAAFFRGGTENREQAVAFLKEFLADNGISVDQVEVVAQCMDVSVDEAEQDLETTLEDALKTARLTVIVTNATTGAVIEGVMVEVADQLGVVQCDNCPGTTDDMGKARLMLSNVPENTTTITVETMAAGFGITSVEANVAASATVITEVALGVDQFALTVTLAGEGSGTVQLAPSGITCDTDCTEEFAVGLSVTLTATPNEGVRFDGWSGDGCSGTAPCTVTMDRDRTVIATFTPMNHTLTVTMSGTGSGSVTSSPAGISCSLSGGTVSGTCEASFGRDSEVTLSASFSDGSTFNGWGGDVCSGTAACTVTMDQDHSVAASFTAPPGTLTVQGGGTGSGTVTSGDGQINCSISAGTVSGVCSASYGFGTEATLTASRSDGSTFTGWSGGVCSGSGTCTVTMNQNRTVTATFTLQPRTLTVQGGGTGSGTVTSGDGQINCSIGAGTVSGVCSASYAFGAEVTLTADDAAGSDFTGWSGGVCSGTGTCTVTTNQNRIVTATFDISQHTLTIIVFGKEGSVSSSDGRFDDCFFGIAPGGPFSCSQMYDNGGEVTLFANPDPEAQFDGWSGDGCRGETRQCMVTMDRDRTVEATFTPRQTPGLIFECISGSTGGDLLFRGFYIPEYPGSSFSRVDLFFSANEPGDYTFSLELRENTYSGRLIGADTTTVILSGDTSDNQLTTFEFPGVIVSPGTTVTFAIEQMSGPSNTVFYAVPVEDPGCPVVQTNDTSPPLSTFRRNGVDIRIFGIGGGLQ